MDSTYDTHWSHTIYMYYAQEESLRLALALKVGFHAVPIPHLRSDSNCLLGSYIATVGSKDVARDSPNVTHFSYVLRLLWIAAWALGKVIG
jgi:hypothetical protein